jgi:hypothetical protein
MKDNAQALCQLITSLIYYFEPAEFHILEKKLVSVSQSCQRNIKSFLGNLDLLNFLDYVLALLPNARATILLNLAPSMFLMERSWLGFCREVRRFRDAQKQK